MTRLEQGDLTGLFPPYTEWVKTVTHPRDSVCHNHMIYDYVVGKFLLAKRVQPKVIVEIGVRLGYSAHAFLSACPEATYIGMDLPGAGHGGTTVAGLEYVQTMLETNFPKAKIELRNVNTQTLKRYEGPTPDLFHVDGDHSCRGAIQDLNLAWSSGTKFILVDDYTFIPEVRKAVDWFIAGEEVEVEYFDTVRGDVLIWSKK